MVLTGEGMWSVSTSVNGGTPSTLLVKGDEAQTFASVTLEAYSLSSCNDFPSNGNIIFDNIVLEDQGVKTTPSWSEAFNQSEASCFEKISFPSENSVELEWGSGTTGTTGTTGTIGTPGTTEGTTKSTNSFSYAVITPSLFLILFLLVISMK